MSYNVSPSIELALAEPIKPRDSNKSIISFFIIRFRINLNLVYTCSGSEGPCYDGPGGACYDGPGGVFNCPRVCSLN